MKPLNQTERKKAFGNFLLFFIITIAVIIIVVFFSIQVPVRDNKKMKNQVSDYKKNEEISKKFSTDISNIQSLVTQLKNDDQNATIQNQIASTLADLQQLKNSLAGNDTMYSATFNALNYLRNVKFSLLNSEKKLEEMNKFETENVRLQNSLNQANTYISTLWSQSGQSGMPRSFQ